MKWPQIVTVILGVIAVAVAVRFRREKPAPPPPPVKVPAAAATAASRVLPPSFDRPGLVSRLTGLLRTYVAVPEEIRFDPSTYELGDRVTAVPILLVFENETYRPLTAHDVGWLGSALCNVRVAFAPDAGADVEVFQADLPLPTRADWLSAERRTLTVDWPLADTGGELKPGRYKVSVRLALPDEPTIEIYTRLL